MRCRMMIGLALLLCTLPGLVRAAPHGTALVIGIGTYDNKPLLPVCIRLANAVAAHLRADRLDVDELTDPDSIVLRSAVGDFADAVLSKSPSVPALIYVCARASTLDHRIFLLPSDATPQAMLRLQTEGTVLHALMNTFTGNNAMLVADLGMSANAADIQAAALDRPDALHVALRAGLGDQLGRFGELLAATQFDESVPADKAAPPDTVWDHLSATLRAGADPGAGVAIAVSPSSPAAEPSPVAAPGITPPSQTALPPNTAVASLSPPKGAAAATPSSVIAASPVPAAGSPVTSSSAALPSATNVEIQRPGSQSYPASAPPTAGTSQPTSVTPSSRPTVADSRIIRIQEALARRGFYHGPIDGVRGSRTRAAIHAFQIALGDPPFPGLTRIEVVKLLSGW